MQYFEKFSLFYKNQFGFTSKHSTIGALVKKITKTVRMRQQHSTIVSFFLDLKKAFDAINHAFFCKKTREMYLEATVGNGFTII